MRCQLLFFVMLPFTLLGQVKAVKIYESTSAYNAANEPSIAINPKNPAQVVAGSNLSHVFSSSDSGKTWQNSLITSSFGVWGDPCVVADADGRFYYFHLSDPTGKNWQSAEMLDRMVCQTSDDGGKTWSDGSYFGYFPPKDQDKEWAAVHVKTNKIAVAWTQFDKYNSRDTAHKTNILFTQSTDRGQTWQTPIILNKTSGFCLDDDEAAEGAVPCFGPDGQIYVAWARNKKIYFDFSVDGGKTWQTEDIFVADQHAGWNFDIPGLSRANGLPVTVCDVSEGPYKGNIYICWGDKETDSTNAEIWFARSTDGGKTWSKKQRINDDNTGRDQFLPWMTVDPITGNIYTVFYDRRRFPNRTTDVFLAWSADGGNTWKNQRISQQPSVFNNTIFLGDYTNISAYNGMVRPIWTEHRDGVTSIWTAILKF